MLVSTTVPGILGIIINIVFFILQIAIITLPISIPTIIIICVTKKRHKKEIELLQEQNKLLRELKGKE